MELVGLLTGPLIYFYGGAFFRWVFIYKSKRSFSDVYQNDKKQNTRLSRLILFIYIIIAMTVINVI